MVQRILVTIVFWTLVGCGSARPVGGADAAANVVDASEPAEDAGGEVDAGPEFVDAGVEEPDAGPEFVDAGVDAVDAGGSIADVEPSSARPTIFDAAINLGNGKLYFFRGADYVRYDVAADRVDTGYPKRIADFWPGLFTSDLDAAVVVDGTLHAFKDDSYVRYDLALDRAEPGFPVAIADAWPGLFPSDLDAVTTWHGGLRFTKGAWFLDWDLTTHTPDPAGPQRLEDGWPGLPADGIDDAFTLSPTKTYVFHGRDYWRLDPANAAPDAGYPKLVNCWWNGLWTPYSGTGDPGPNLPDQVRALLSESPTATEIAARKARVRASISGGYRDRSEDYPLFLASVEARLGAFGCLLLEDRANGVWRFRCASDTNGTRALELEPFRAEWTDWRRAAHHVEQASQGDFLADPGTPLTIRRSDDGTFRVVQVLTDPSTGSISGGTRIRVRFRTGGVDKEIQFSHLNTAIPRYVLDAVTHGTPLANGTVFGFIGHTGNLWIAAPPAVDAPYTGTGAGLPDAHTHAWFVSQPENHRTLAAFAREAMDYCGAYPFGGG